MKKIIVVIILLVLAGCKTSDKEIRADIAGKAQEDLNFAGLQYTANDGVVDFTGRCPSQKAFTKIRQIIENIHVIKTVRYRVSIAPVTIDTLTPVKLQADSLLAQFPRVTADITPQNTTLKGYVTVGEKLKLMNALHLPQISLIKDSLTVRW